MKMKIFYLVIGLMLVVSCDKTEDNKKNQDLKITPIDLPEGGDMVVTSSNKFGFDIFQRTINSESVDKNVFISPTSISLALAMTWNGARNSTADSMAYALRLPDLTNTEINAAYKSLIDGLSTVDEKVLLKIANSIWYRQDFTVEQDFITVNQDYYYSEVTGLDFGNPSSINVINSWVEDKTNGKIKNLLTQIDPSDVMYLINAIYFKGIWQIEFDKDKTKDAPFYLADGSQKTVPMMNMEDTLNYFSNDIVRAVELDYGRGNYSMVLLMPNTGKSIIDIVNALNPENWSDWTNGFHKTDIILSMPRFKFEYEKTLNEILMDMGMGIAFGGFADFTGINHLGGLEISYVKHKSFVEINEEGTEAAAATIVAIREVSFLDNNMYFNQPFIFAIREKSTGSIVFIGRVSDPEI
jgi:serine protease inhibitor